jgi:hypothetical protein
MQNKSWLKKKEVTITYLNIITKKQNVLVNEITIFYVIDNFKNHKKDG